MRFKRYLCDVLDILVSFANKKIAADRWIVTMYSRTKSKQPEIFYVKVLVPGLLTIESVFFSPNATIVSTVLPSDPRDLSSPSISAAISNSVILWKPKHLLYLLCR
jgi:hypothetical protein